MVGADVPGGPRPPGRPHARGMDVPVRAAWTSPAHGAPRTSRPTSRRIPAPPRSARAHGGHGVFVVGADVLGGPRPRNVPMRAAWTSPCAHGRPRARGMDVPCARRAEDVAPYQPTHPVPPPGAARAHGGHGGVCGRGRRPRRPASPERPRARGMDVPMRAARRGRRALPAGASRPPAGAARAHGGHGGVCGRGRRPRRPASPERSHARSAGVPCAQRARPPARDAPRTSRPTSRASRSPLP